MSEPLAVDHGFLGNVGAGFAGLMALQERPQIEFAVFPAVNQRKLMFEIPGFSGADFTTTPALTAAFIGEKHPQPDPIGDFAIGRVAHPLWQRPAHARFQSSY